MRCCLSLFTAVSLLLTIAASQKITWKQSREQANCATAKKYLCGRVHSVHDGDTIRVQPDTAVAAYTKAVRIRLLQLDAPELSQPHGIEARDALSQVLPYGSHVCIVSPGTDHYRRVLGFVCLSDKAGEWLDVNAWLVEGGYAWCYLRRCCTSYATAEEAAKAAGRGLWASGGKDLQPPWVYRRQQRRPKVRFVASGSSTRTDDSSQLRK